MPRRGPRDVGDFALDPESGKTALEQFLGLPIELTDCDRARDGVRLARIIHVCQYIGARIAFAEKIIGVQLTV